MGFSTTQDAGEGGAIRVRSDSRKDTTGGWAQMAQLAYWRRNQERPCMTSVGGGRAH